MSKDDKYLSIGKELSIEVMECLQDDYPDLNPQNDASLKEYIEIAIDEGKIEQCDRCQVWESKCNIWHGLCENCYETMKG